MKQKRVLTLYQLLYLKMIEKRNTWHNEQRFPGRGENKDQIIYIVRRSGMKLGLFSLFNTTLARIDYAYRHGMIPVVDMQNFNNSYLEEGELGFINSWEKYFDQPSCITLEEAYRCKKIILSQSEVPSGGPNDDINFLYDYNKELTYWRNVRKKYIHVKESIITETNKKYDSFAKSTDRVLGVLARGTDYTKLRPSQHPIQPTTEQLICKTQQVIKEQNCNKIFLATEDSAIAEKFKAEFGNSCILGTEDFVNYKNGYLAEIKTDSKDEKYLRGLNYLINILILAKSNCIVAGRTSGTVGACLFSDGWEYSYFFDLGKYE